MLEQIKIKWVYILSALFIIINGVFVAYEQYYFMLLPLAFVIGIYYIKALDKVLLFIVFCTPLSIIAEIEGAKLSLSLPTEPLMIGVLVLYFFKFMVEGGVENNILKHPITLAISFNLMWVLLTACTSTAPLVSFKFLIARLWFVVPFYFLAIVMFRNYKNITKFSWYYIVPMAIVAGYTMVMHSTHGFDEESAHWVMDPFFNDHTSYGAMLAFFFPILIGLALNSESTGFTKLAAWGFLFFYTLAIILSYTRAAWVSLIAAIAVMLIMHFKVKFRTLLIIAGAIISIALFNIDKLLMKLEKNRQDSSDNLTEHVQSISNISSDASNLERLNRWSSAIRMFKEKPLFGWGPGTYMFKYAPFQRASEKTIISTNAGDAGNAHSEYIGPLAESGVMGAVSILAIVVAFAFTAFKLYYKLPKGRTKMLVLSIFLGLITYFVHGALNNFLDTDKAAVPVFGFLAMLTAIDLYHSGKNEESDEAVLLKGEAVN